MLANVFSNSKSVYLGNTFFKTSPHFSQELLDLNIFLLKISQQSSLWPELEFPRFVEIKSFLSTWGRFWNFIFKNSIFRPNPLVLIRAITTCVLNKTPFIISTSGSDKKAGEVGSSLKKLLLIAFWIWNVPLTHKLTPKRICSQKAWHYIIC